MDIRRYGVGGYFAVDTGADGAGVVELVVGGALLIEPGGACGDGGVILTSGTPGAPPVACEGSNGGDLGAPFPFPFDPELDDPGKTRPVAEIGGTTVARNRGESELGDGERPASGVSRCSVAPLGVRV